MARLRHRRDKWSTLFAATGATGTRHKRVARHIASSSSIECISSCRKMPECGKAGNCGDYVFRIITFDDKGK